MVWMCGCVGVWVCEFADVNVAKSKRRGGGGETFAHSMYKICNLTAVW